MLGFICFLGILFFIIVSYLMGSIPFGFIFVKTQKKDLTSIGSKNIGATNVIRNTNKTLGLLTLIFDFLKGYLAVLFSACVFKLMYSYDPNFFMHLFPLAYLSCFFVALGHCFSIFIKFKGGKAVSTTGGVLLAVSPILFLIASLVLIITFLIFKIVSLASVITAGTIGLVCFIPWFNYYYLAEILGLNSYDVMLLSMEPAHQYFYVLGISIIIMCTTILIISKHYENIDRLLLKKERLFQIGKDEVTQQDIINKKKNENK